MSLAWSLGWWCFISNNILNVVKSINFKYCSLCILNHLRNFSLLWAHYAITSHFISFMVLHFLGFLNYMEFKLWRLSPFLFLKICHTVCQFPQHYLPRIHSFSTDFLNEFLAHICMCVTTHLCSLNMCLCLWGHYFIFHMIWLNISNITFPFQSY